MTACPPCLRTRYYPTNFFPSLGSKKVTDSCLLCAGEKDSWKLSARRTKMQVKETKFIFLSFYHSNSNFGKRASSKNAKYLVGILCTMYYDREGGRRWGEIDSTWSYGMRENFLSLSLSLSRPRE